MTRILTIIALLFATSAFGNSGNYGNSYSADGKSFFCEPIGDLGKTLGLTFRNGKPITLYQDGTESEVRFYFEKEDAYWWASGGIVYEISRQNLRKTMWMDETNERADWQCAMEELDVIKTKLKALHEEYLRNRPKNKF